MRITSSEKSSIDSFQMLERFVLIFTLLFLLNTQLTFLYEKNDFAEVSKNLTRYRSENNFVVNY